MNMKLNGDESNVCVCVCVCGYRCEINAFNRMITNQTAIKNKISDVLNRIKYAKYKYKSKITIENSLNAQISKLPIEINSIQ